MTTKSIEELEREIAHLRAENERLDMENVRLLGRNRLMSEQLNCWYELRQRVNWLKAEMERGRRLAMKTDQVDDAELLAMLEERLEKEPHVVTPEFGTPELADAPVPQLHDLQVGRGLSGESAPDACHEDAQGPS